MSTQVSTGLNLTRVGRVCVTVSDTDRALDFYVGKLGFEKVVDVPMGPDLRWVEVSLPGTPTTIALAPRRRGARRAEVRPASAWTRPMSTGITRP